MSGARRALVGLALAAALGGAARATAAPGAWETFIRPRAFTDLLALQDEVWGATAEAGLLRWDRLLGRFETVRREPGSIASNRLTALARDRMGRLWVGTAGSGISRRSSDRRRWEVVNRLDGLPADSVTVLEVAGDTLWIGTSRGIALWNGREITGSLPDATTISFDTTFANVFVTGVVVRGDSLWMSTRRGVGLARLSTLLGDWRPVVQGLGGADVRALASDGAALFAHLAGDVYRFRDDLGRWELEPGAGVVHKLRDEHGFVLAGGESGVFRWRHTETDSGWVPLVGSPAASASAARDPEPAVDEDGRAFVGRGESLFEQVSDVPGEETWVERPAPEGPPGNGLLHVALEGPKVYVTTVDEGVGRYAGGAWRHWPPQPCAGAECDTTFLNPSFAFGLLVDTQGRKWVGSWSQALESFDDSVSPTQLTRHVQAGEDLTLQRRTWVVVAAVDSGGGRWFGMDTPDKGNPAMEPLGLTAYDRAGAYLGNFDASSGLSGSFVHGLAVTRNGRVWVGFDGEGLDFFIPPAGRGGFVHLSSTNNLAVRGLAAHGDSLWAITTGELLRFSAEAGPGSLPAARIPVRGGQAQFGVHPLAVGPDGVVWAGTTAGLKVFRPGGAIDSFTTANSALPDDEVRAVAVDRATGVVWVATAGGLGRYDPSFVPPAPPIPPRLQVRVFPNPARLTALGVRLRLAGDAESYRGEIYDLEGRRVARFVAAGNGLVIWDGRDERGDPVSPGVYFIRAQSGGRQAVARVALLR